MAQTMSDDNIPCLDKNETLSISIINNIDLPSIIKGESVYSLAEDQVIVFQIECCLKKNIRITLSESIEDSGLIIESELRSGPQTGFEYQFISGNIYTPVNNKYFVTMKLTTIKTSMITFTGKYTLNPSITVEYID